MILEEMKKMVVEIQKGLANHNEMHFTQNEMLE